MRLGTKLLIGTSGGLLLIAGVFLASGLLTFEPTFLTASAWLAGVALVPGPVLMARKGLRLLNESASERQFTNQNPMAANKDERQLIQHHIKQDWETTQEAEIWIPVANNINHGEDLVATDRSLAKMSTGLAQGSHTSCPFCAETILLGARKCKHCGEYLDAALRLQQSSFHSAPSVQVIQNSVPHQSSSGGGMAALLSFFWPGLGQMVTGRMGAGFGWMVLTFLGYILFIIPGLILHLFCIIDAANGSKS